MHPLKIRHIKKRVPARVASEETALCGALAGEKAWRMQDARDMYRLVVECDVPANSHNKTWKFCPDCVEKLWPAPTSPRSAITRDALN